MLLAGGGTGNGGHAVNLVFTRCKDNKNFVVLNVKSFAPHDKIYGIPTFSSDNKYVVYGARDGQDLFWVADKVE